MIDLSVVGRLQLETMYTDVLAERDKLESDHASLQSDYDRVIALQDLDGIANAKAVLEKKLGIALSERNSAEQVVSSEVQAHKQTIGERNAYRSTLKAWIKALDKNSTVDLNEVVKVARDITS